MVCPGDGENYFFKLFFGRKGRLAWFSLVVENNHRLAYYVAARRHGRAHCQDDEIFVWFEPKRDILLLEGKDTVIYSYGARGMAPHSAEGEACARTR